MELQEIEYHMQFTVAIFSSLVRFLRIMGRGNSLLYESLRHLSALALIDFKTSCDG